MQFGSVIGVGNFVAREGERIRLESNVLSTALHGVAKSTTSMTSVTLCPDSVGKLGKIASASGFFTAADSGGNNLVCNLYDSRGNKEAFIITPTSGINTHGGFTVSVKGTGVFKYDITASGSNTFSIGNFQYTEVQL